MRESRQVATIPDSPEFERLAQGAQFRDRVARLVQATPDVTFDAFRAITLADMPVAWVLGEMRYWPMRIVGRMPAAQPHLPFLQTLVANGTVILHEDRRQIVTGSAGRLHRIDQQPVPFSSRDDFSQFADDRFQKLFMSVRTVPADGDGPCWLVLDHATRALSSSAERAFARYWKVIRPVGAFVTARLLAAVAQRSEEEAKHGHESMHTA